MELRALIFDVDGTLADTERRGHLPACNEAFAKLGFPIRWSWEEFLGMQHIPGNVLRMRSALERLTPPLAGAALDDAVVRLSDLKRQLYIEKYLPGITLRPGIASLVAAAVVRDVRLAIVSTSDEEPIHALLRARLPESAARFQPVLGKESGRKTAPESPLYRRCLAQLGTRAEETLVIEDAEPGVRAAVTAGLPCAVFYNDYTCGTDFRGARLVARSAEFFDLDTLATLCLVAP